MNSSFNKSYFDDKELIEDIRTLLGISIGAFLLFLFFQPFDFEPVSFDTKLILITGLSGIIFAFLSLFYIFLPRILSMIFKNLEWENRSDYLIISLIGIFTSVASTFYLHYVGAVKLSIFIVFKIVLFSFFSPILLRLICIIKSLENQNNSLQNRNHELQNILKNYISDNQTQTIEIYSENNSEKIALFPDSIVTIKSADNYIEIFYLDHDSVKKQLLRTSLKTVDEQLRHYNNFLRCHRTSIVNIKFAGKLVRNINGYSLVLKNFDQEIPVSRQYILKVKDALNKES